MYVILRILKHMALVDFVALPTYSLEQCALYILEEIWWKWIYVLVLWGKLGMKWEMVPHYVTQASWDVSRKSWANSFYLGKVSGFCFITFPFIKSDNLQYNTLVCWADGTNDSSTKRLNFQVFFLHTIFCRLRAHKTLYFHFCNFIKR